MKPFTEVKNKLIDDIINLFFKVLNKSIVPLSVILFFIYVIGTIFCFQSEIDANPSQPPFDSYLTGCLLITPFFFQSLVVLIGCIKMKNDERVVFMFVSITLTAFSITPYLTAWYLFNNKYESEIFSFLCLFAIFILIVSLIILAFLLIHPEELTSLEHYRKGLKELHFLAVLHFFAVFLSIAFLGGFTLAFHDKANGGEALYKESLYFDGLNETSIAKKGFEDTTCLYFDIYDNKNSNGTKIDLRKTVPKGEDIKKYSEWRGYYNNKNLKNITDYIKDAYNQDKGMIPYITLLGKTDPKPIKSDVYPNNLALSVARTDSTQKRIKDELKELEYALWERISWQMSSVSSDDKSLFTQVSKRDKVCGEIIDDKDSNKRVVEIKVEFVSDLIIKENLKPKTDPMRVLDYMYFSMQTITTTGYGDIKPVTPYAKMVCLLENIIEVFFLVIFINIVIAFKDSKTRDEFNKELKPIKETLEFDKQKKERQKKEWQKKPINEIKLLPKSSLDE